MLKAVLFDLFETLVTESRTQPAGVSSLAPELGCDRAAFRREWKALRTAVMTGRLSFHQALSDITTRLGGHADELTLQRLCNRRIALKQEPFEQIEPRITAMVDSVRRHDLRVGVVSNCWSEAVVSWPQSSLAPRIACTVFSYEVGMAKPHPAIYLEAARRLGVDVADTWYIGDGGDDELAGARQAGLRPFRALWFLERWPHFRDEPTSDATPVRTPEEFVALVEHAL